MKKSYMHIYYQNIRELLKISLDNNNHIVFKLNFHIWISGREKIYISSFNLISSEKKKKKDILMSDHRLEIFTLTRKNKEKK